MSDHDSARAAFDALRADVMPAIRKPGVEATRRTVQRRRRRATGLALAGVAAIIAAGLILLPGDRGHTPVINPSASPSPVESASPSPSPTAESVGAQATETPPPDCVSDNFVLEPDQFDGTTARIVYRDMFNRGKPLCPGIRLNVIWAAYTVDAQVVAHKAQSGTSYLDSTKRSMRVTVNIDPGCSRWFGVKAGLEFPGKGLPDTFQGWKFPASVRAGYSYGFYDMSHMETGFDEGLCATPTP